MLVYTSVLQRESGSRRACRYAIGRWVELYGEYGSIRDVESLSLSLSLSLALSLSLSSPRYCWSRRTGFLCIPIPARVVSSRIDPGWVLRRNRGMPRVYNNQRSRHHRRCDPLEHLKSLCEEEKEEEEEEEEEVKGSTVLLTVRTMKLTYVLHLDSGKSLFCTSGWQSSTECFDSLLYWGYLLHGKTSSHPEIG